MSDTTVTAPAMPTAFAAAEPGLFVPNYPLPRLHRLSQLLHRLRLPRPLQLRLPLLLPLPRPRRLLRP